MDLETFTTPGLGDASYLVASEGEAVLVDPQRDAWRFLALAERRGWRVTHVLETHVHNDYVSGALEVRVATGATIVAPARGGYAFPHRPADEGTVVELGPYRLTAMATPGHTPEHLAWAVAKVDVEHAGRAAPPPEAVFTGGSLLVGTAGRTDLLGPGETATLTALQADTLRRLAAMPPGVRILPTHGTGSFCSAGPATPESASTVGIELASNPVLRAMDAGRFEEALLGGLGRYPAYYAHMAPINRAGPRILGGPSVPLAMPAEAFAAAVARGTRVVDARDREAFAAGHVPGSLNIELGDTFAAYVGWLTPFGAELLLVVPNPAPEAAAAATGQLMRIGYEHVTGYLDGGVDAWASAGHSLSAYPVTSIAAVHDEVRAGGAPDLLDVRQPTEWRDEGRVPGARTIFVADVPAALPTLPRDHEITVMCKSGSRAAIAASLLDAAGIPVRLVATGGAADWPGLGAGVR